MNICGNAGSTGQYLNEQISDDDVSLFISRDGGSTWSLVIKKAIGFL